jgi:hypothetical protein
MRTVLRDLRRKDVPATGKRSIRHRIALVLAMLMTVGGALVITSSPALANAGCGVRGTDRDSSPIHRPVTSGSVNIRTGSSTSCTAISGIYPGDEVEYFCYTSAPDGRTWTYLHLMDTGAYGWSRDDLLNDFGSYSYCGF